MSTSHVYIIKCDAPGCTAQFTRDLSRADETRMYAAREGWTHGRRPPEPRRGTRAQSLDYCSQHAELSQGLFLPPLPIHAIATSVEPPRAELPTPAEMTTAEVGAHTISIAAAETKETFVRAFAAYVCDVVQRETEPFEKISLFVHAMVEGQRETITTLTRWRGGGAA